MARFHVPDDVLMDYAHGRLDEAKSLLVAAHLTFCPECRHTLALFESVGAFAMEEAEGAEIGDGMLDALFARIDADGKDGVGMGGGQAIAEAAPTVMIGGMPVPRPLLPYLPAGNNGHEIPWRQMSPSLAMWDVPLGETAYKTKMLRVKGGRRMPEHTHVGEEMFLVLSGGFTDEKGHYVRGDVAVSDHTQRHSPIADKGEDCIGLVVVDAPLRLTGPITRFLNPFVRF